MKDRPRPAMTKLIRVRLVDADTLPFHGHQHLTASEQKKISWAQWRGKPILLGAPQAPLPGHWTCDTDLVWPVREEEILRSLYGKNWRGASTSIYVCRHQIQAGD